LGERYSTVDNLARVYTPPMISEIQISSVQKDGKDGVIVTFTDGTMGAYVVEELLELRPFRETVEESRGTRARERSALN
jgi:hypothetical protein